jgi:hypothetical protein
MSVDILLLFGLVLCVVILANTKHTSICDILNDAMRESTITKIPISGGVEKPDQQTDFLFAKERTF